MSTTRPNWATGWRGLLLAAAMAPVYWLLIAGSLAQFYACASARSGEHVLTEVRLKTALDILREVIEPSSKLASAACLDQQRAAVAAARDGGLAVEAARAQVAETRTRCDAIGAAFTEIRQLHGEAATLLESGAIQETEARVRELRDAWKRLDRGGGEP